MNSKEVLLGLMATCNVGLVVSRREDACRVLADTEGDYGTVAHWSGAGPCFPKDVIVGVQDWPTGKYGQWDSNDVDDEYDALFDAIDPLAALEILTS